MKKFALKALLSEEGRIIKDSIFRVRCGQAGSGEADYRRVEDVVVHAVAGDGEDSLVWLVKT